MCENLFLVTSVINIPNLPFSYTKTRSIYTMNERFEQTINTINSIKNKIPDVKILFIECSELPKEFEDYLIQNCDYFINVYNDEVIRNKVFGLSKSLGEGTLILNSINFVETNNIKFKNFFKISGRYFLSNNFKYSNYDNNLIIVQKINNDINNISTFLFKLNYNNLFLFKFFLNNRYEKMVNCIGFEVLFSEFINCIDNKNIISYVDVLGIQGFIAVSGDIIDR